jgi:natural product precursor
MKTKNPLRKLTLIKTTVAHLDSEQMTAARGGSCGGTWMTYGCTQGNSYNPETLLTCK